jgi:hypothetical protein
LQFAADEGPEHVDRDVEGAATIFGSLVQVIGATVESVEVRSFTVDDLVSPVVEINEALVAISLLIHIPKLTGGAIECNHHDAVETVRALVVTVVERPSAIGDIELVAVVAVAVAPYVRIGKDPGEADVPAAATVAIGSVAGGASEDVSAGSPTATARMLSLGLIVLIMVASAAAVIATAIVSTPVISIATIVAAAVLALVRTDSVGPVGAAIISSTIVVSSVVVTSVVSAGLTLIWSSAIDSFLTIAITTGVALVGAATGCSIATGVSILGAIATGLAAIACGAFFLCVVTCRESHLGR